MSLGVYVSNHVLQFQTNPAFQSIAVASIHDLKIVIPVAIITWVKSLIRTIFKHNF